MIAERATTFGTSDGVVLEAHLALPPAAPAGVVACHPHPLYGGDMHNPVVVRAIEACGTLGLATLRFNFRGVGASTGAHDGGPGEERDAEAALDHLREALGPTAPVGLVGYSFGATVSARVAGRQALAGLVLIAPPIALAGPAPFEGLESFPGAFLIIAGSRDEFCPAKQLEDLGRRLPRGAVTVIEGANHFFFGKLFPLGEALTAWARQLQAGEAGRGRGSG
jgi:alpha/beta superfamily hydrolase